jgi:hypothetical protein
MDNDVGATAFDIPAAAAATAAVLMKTFILVPYADNIAIQIISIYNSVVIIFVKLVPWRACLTFSYSAAAATPGKASMSETAIWRKRTEHSPEGEALSVAGVQMSACCNAN